MFNYEISKIERFKEQFVEKYTNERIISFANNLISSELNLGYDSIEKVFFNIDNLIEFDWLIQVNNSQNTFRLYLFGLRHVYLLSKAYELTNFENYLSLAKEFIDSFYNFYFNSGKKDPMLDNDHAISERIENLVYFLSIVNKWGEEENYDNSKVIKLLNKDLNKLLTDDYYQKNHNHGIIVDKAALIGTIFLNNKNLTYSVEKILNRLEKQVNFAFFKDGVHKENSIDYHIIVINLLISILNCLELIEHSYGKILKKKIESSISFLVYSYKPNLDRPLFGDSKGVNGNKIPIIDTYNNSNLEYIKSKGNIGKKPNELLKWFQQSGYVFLREHFNQNNFSDSTWISFKAGYETRTHKHKDDLSFCLYSKGYDIFVDSGMSGYMPKNKYKEYMESMSAHNTIGVKDISYSIAKANGEKFKILNVKSEKDYYEINSKSNVYNNIVIYRRLFYFYKKNSLLIYDELFSSNENNYVQYFNLGKEISILEKNNNEIVLEGKNKNFIVKINQLLNIDKLNILSGETTFPYSLISEGFDIVKNTESLEFEKIGKNEKFLTLIEIHDSIYDSEKNKIKLTKNRIKIDKIQIELAKNSPLLFPKIKIQTSNKKLLIQSKLEDNQEHTIYLLNDKNEYQKLSYSKNKKINLILRDQYNSYTIIYFLRKNKNEMIKGILGDIYRNGNIFEIKKEYEIPHTPQIKEKCIYKIDYNTYKFVVNIEYDYEFKASWWVYHNGAKTFFEENSSKEFIYTFNEKGEYVIMCSFRDRLFGEFYFDQFDKVIL